MTPIYVYMINFLCKNNTVSFLHGKLNNIFVLYMHMKKILSNLKFFSRDFNILKFFNLATIFAMISLFVIYKYN